MNNVTTSRKAVIYLASTNSKGKSGYATSTRIESVGMKKPYQKWFANGFEDKSRRDATIEGLHQALANIQSRCAVIIYCNERFVDLELVDKIIHSLDNTRYDHVKGTGRIVATVVKPEPDTPQEKHLAKVTDLAKWARAAGCNML